MSNLAEDTVAVLDTHGFLYCPECCKVKDLVKPPYVQLKYDDLLKMTHSGDPAHFHSEDCDGCDRIWGVPDTKATARWVYPHELVPMTPEEKKTSHGFFLDGGPNGEIYLIPFKHKAEWLAWRDENINEAIYDEPEFCTEVKDITSVVFEEYKIDD